ncbi:MAG: hypothetical protein SWC96_14085 [Thermodesulfobacteriota bacterium]|nr:hypothetical protein [Thermodesulfobacteriota bacterium]
MNHHHDSHDHSHGHDHGHHHDHHHTHAGDGEMSTREKLVKLFDYWLRHNESHCDTYTQWIDQAEQEGLSDTAAILKEIADLTRQITDKFQAGAATLKK